MSERRCAVVAIVGAPNAGKSTLVNALVGRKVAIVTHKVQTTRYPLRGVAMRGETQLVLIDTPGVFEAKRRLDRAMVRAAWASAEGADAVVHLVDASAEARIDAGDPSGADKRAHDDAMTINAALQAMPAKSILVLNKIDAMPREALLAVSRRWFDTGAYAKAFMVSALNRDGIEDLAAHLGAIAPQGPWLFPEDDIADAPSRMIAAEITREKLMLRLHDEVPYDATVATEAWQERKDGSVRIEQTIYVQRESQRKIAIGNNARTVKAIGQAAREEMETLFERKVHLFLHVKVQEKWSEDRALFQSLGLDWDA
ncbi:MAG: GTPase Era [Alphaproteobacteria bacterium]|nr:GTPase Era [Alphaproteobacteria bacterium]